MNRHSPKGFRIALLVTGVLLMAAATASGTTRKSITLKLHGGTVQKKTACHQTRPHRYRLYRLHTKVSMEGWVVPAPSQPDGAWRVKIKFKQCKAGRFVFVAEVHVDGRRVVVNGVKEGHFTYTRTLGVKGVFFARAYYYGYNPPLISADKYFSVTP